ncbi:dTDP-4-dehydrorhamnose 3,5-epimerase [Panacibacter ginsenosidivorans]|uniref:dTDP-4-dehydrorhamnose 3,5-epimerase n=1 Tax=Panacibacter ginsenosidivorans TaxID=1813871 RepID=A0A5B8VA70_9BACT|nr:dTDP-4-dehydrorhamnose 3,5-epimerase [Panacibacter ginsenosidivorans]QEC68015.1 dTDP-4-dehydrorhamnose 3,5-epimerase [Panacibacter ginsenosidivorans]
MRIEETPLKDCYIIHDTVFEDSRGYFFESFNQQKFTALTGIANPFVQDNQSRSVRGVLRGLHFQRGEHAQAKLVRVLQGSVLDVAVDIRKDSPTFGKHFAMELSDTSKTQLYIPRGFAHGFIVLSDTAVFFYKCDNVYNKQSESGIIYNDPALGIDWKLDEASLLLSEKDKVNPLLKDITETL